MFILIAIILGIILVVGIEALVYWGIGNLIIWAFAIPFTFTYPMALAISLTVSLIVSIFSNIFKKE